jgi:hypothetical protein
MASSNKKAAAKAPAKLKDLSPKKLPKGGALKNKDDIAKVGDGGGKSGKSGPPGLISGKTGPSSGGGSPPSGNPPPSGGGTG